MLPLITTSCLYKSQSRTTHHNMSIGQTCYMATGHPEVEWAPIGFAVAIPWATIPRLSFWGGPLLVLQCWQPHDPLNTLVIPNFA